MTLDEMYDFLVEWIGVPEESIRVVTGLYGYNEENMILLLSYYTGYRDFEQCKEEMMEE